MAVFGSPVVVAERQEGVLLGASGVAPVKKEEKAQEERGQQ